MALSSTQPLTEMSNRNISWEAKAAGAWGRLSRNSASLNLLEPSEPIQAFTLTIQCHADTEGK